ncbi:MAG: hypothetical protein ACM3UU_09780 [Ignavibacteriales bacterium]
MKKRVFLLSFAFMILFIFTMNYSCFASGYENSYGLTINYDNNNFPIGFTSNVQDTPPRSSVHYRTAIASYNITAYTDASCNNAVDPNGITIINAPVAWDPNISTEYSGIFPGNITQYFNNNPTCYFKMVLFPVVQAYFTKPNTSVALRSIPLNEHVNHPDDQWGYHTNFPGDSRAYSDTNIVIESFSCKDSVFWSHLDWMDGSEYSINTRFQEQSLVIPPPTPSPRITFLEFVGSQYTKIEDEKWECSNMPVSATNDIQFKYKIESKAVPVASYNGQNPRTPDFIVAIYKKDPYSDNYIDRKDMLTSPSPVYEASARRYLAPNTGTNGRSASCSEVINVGTGYTASFNLDTSTLTPGKYKVSLVINDPTSPTNHGIELYVPQRHHAEFTFTIGSGLNLAITGITASSPNLLPGQTYTATAKYSVSGSFPAGAKVTGLRKLPAPVDTTVNNQFAANSTSGTGLSPSAVPMTEGNNYIFQFPFTVPANIPVGDKITLRAEIIPVDNTVVETIPYDSNPALTDNVKEVELEVISDSADTAGYLNVGILPASEMLKYFKDQVRVNSYWYPMGNSNFTDCSWDPQATNPVNSSGTAYLGEPTVNIKTQSVSGTTTLSGDTSKYHAGSPPTYELYCANTGSNTLVERFEDTDNDKILDKYSDADSDGTPDKDEIIELSCQTDSHTANHQNQLDFGTNPNHDHNSHSHGGTSFGNFSGPDEGGCTNIGEDYP